MVNVVVTRPKTINVTANTVGNIIQPAAPITLKNDTTVTSGGTRLDKLQDVDASTETENATLVYDSTTDKYVVKQLDVDGGNF